MNKMACQGRQWRPVMMWLALLPAFLWVQVQAQQEVTLQSLSFADLPGNSFEVRLDFDAEPPVANGFVLESPARVSIDLSATRSALGQREFPISSGNAESLMVLETSDRTRLVFNLRQTATYETRVDGQSLIVTLTSDSPTVAASADPSAPAAETQTPEEPRAEARSRVAAAAAISDVQFQRGDARGEGLVAIELSDAGQVPSTERSGLEIRIEFSGVDVPEHLNRRFDVTDFATPVSTVDVLPRQGNAAIILDMEEDYEHVAWQTGRFYYVSVSPRGSDVASRDPAAEYSGTEVSLSFQDIDVRSVLQILADENDFNLVASDGVAGTVTLQLDNVPWDQALDLVLQSRNLDKRLVGNVLYVAPAEEIAAQQQLAIEASRQAEALEPLYTEYVQVNYADASNIMNLLTGSEAGSMADADGDGSGPAEPRGILSARGTATVDPRTNIIIIRDVSSKLEEVRELLGRLDIPVRQVLIEARIVNVSTDLGRDLGVRWGGGGFSRGGSGFHYSGSIDSSAEITQGLNDPDGGPVNISFPEALAVDLGAQGDNASTFSIGFARNSNLIELELSALESTGNGEVIARPKVTTQDKVTANIQSGVRIPYQAQAGGTAGGSTTEFVDAVLSLEVTPQITPDGRIIMELNIHQDSVAPGSGNVPAINTNSVNTSVLVDNGDTVVLGGIFREETTTTETKTPVLGDVPYFGRLFKRTSTESRRTELLIFITPRIIAELSGAR